MYGAILLVKLKIKIISKDLSMCLWDVINNEDFLIIILAFIGKSVDRSIVQRLSKRAIQ